MGVWEKWWLDKETGTNQEVREHFAKKIGKKDTQGGWALWKEIIALGLCGEGGKKEHPGARYLYWLSKK